MHTNDTFDFSGLDHPQYEDILLHQHVGLDFSLPFSLLKINAYNSKQHRHRYLQILYVLSGSIRHSLLHWEIDAEEGDLIFIPSYVPHQITPRYPDAQILLYELEFPPDFLLDEKVPTIFETPLFDFSGLDPANASDIPPRAAQPIHLIGEARQYVERALAEMETAYKNRFLHCDCMLMLRAQTIQLFVYLSRYLERTGSSNVISDERDRKRLIPIIRYLHDNYSQPNICINTLCRAAAMSPAAFRRAFRRLTGKTPVEYIHMLRIEQAARLIRSQADYTIAEIAFSCGFQSPAHFNRIFKRLSGMTPSALKISNPSK